MEKRIVNLNEILDDEMSEHMSSHISQIPYLKEWIIDAMKEACKQTLELAAENAEFIYCENGCDVPENVISTGDEEYGFEYISKNSITETIKQVE